MGCERRYCWDGNAVAGWFILIRPAMSMYNWEGDLVPVQGFGFLPHSVELEIENRFEVRSCVCVYPISTFIDMLSYEYVCQGLARHTLSLLKIN